MNKDYAHSMQDDTISRQAAIDALGEKPLAWTEGEYETGLQNQWESDVEALKQLPSAQPEHLTDDDFETIRIHLSAYKGGLCNQRRWEEAEEYQKIIDRFMSFASAQPERKKGKWKRRIVDNGWNADWVCSECGYRVHYDFVNFNYCPDCGADMRCED